MNLDENELELNLNENLNELRA